MAPALAAATCSAHTQEGQCIEPCSPCCLMRLCLPACRGAVDSGLGCNAAARPLSVCSRCSSSTGRGGCRQRPCERRRCGRHQISGRLAQQQCVLPRWGWGCRGWAWGSRGGAAAKLRPAVCPGEAAEAGGAAPGAAEAAAAAAAVGHRRGAGRPQASHSTQQGILACPLPHLLSRQPRLRPLQAISSPATVHAVSAGPQKLALNVHT